MKVLSKLDSLDNIQDGETRKLITKTSSSGSGNIISDISVSGDTIEYTKGTLQPLETKTYTDIIGVTDNTDANCAFFFGSVRPESFTKTWAVKYRIHVWCESNANYNAVADVFFEGAQSGLASYAVFNNIYNTSYRPVYYHSMYRLTQTGYNANYGHALGFSLRDSNERLTTSLMRTVKIELLEYRNCTVTLNDEAVKWANWPGTGTTNYGSIGSYNFSSNGLQETGDANDNTIAYQIRTNSGIWANKTGYNTNRYTLLFEVNGGLSGAATSIGTSTSKTTVAFKYIPKGVIKYNTTNASVANNANISATGLWDQYAIDLRNTFNIGSTLVSGKPVYMRCVVNNDGTLTPNYAGSPSHPIVQTLPTTADGYAYVYLGQAYSTTSMELKYNHPIYEYKDGKIREWQYDSGGTISDVKVNNTSIVSSGVANLVTESTYDSSTNKIATKNDIPTKTSDITNDSGFITSSALSNYVTLNTEQTITGKKTFSGNVIIGDVNKATYTTSDTTNITPNNEGIANPPWNSDLWHDHFAFLRYHTIESQESTTDGTIWESTEKELEKLFYQKDGDTVEILSSNENAFRFVLKNSSFAYSGLSWFEISTYYTNPFSNFSVLIEHSTDQETWNTCHQSIITGSSSPYYLRNGYSIVSDGYLRFTFTKQNNLTTGTVKLTCIKGFCTRKGSQGLGIEYEYPYDWDYNANILPYSNNTKSLGSSTKKWANVYATTFNGDLTGTANSVNVGAGSSNVERNIVVANGNNLFTVPNVTANYSNGTITATKLKGQLDGTISSATTATTQTQGDNSTKIATTAYVDTAIDNLPEPMVFKGSLGTGGTVTTLPVNGSANIGDTYKVITAGTYASKAAKVGDTFICLTKTSSANTWELIPSGDEPSGTVTSVKINATGPIAIDSNAAITTSGERTISHSNSGVTAGTYKSVTVNATGHVTAGTNPTTLSGYGITDAKIDNGVITLGSNTITPVTDTSDKVSKSGDTMSGDLTIQKDTPKLTLKATNTSDVKINIGNSNYSRDAILASNASVNGYNLMIDSGGRTIIGSGEAGLNLHNALGKNQDSEQLYLISDGSAYFDSNAQTVANRVGFVINNYGSLVPTVADVSTNNSGAIGTPTYNWNNMYAANYNFGNTAATITYNSTDKCIEFNFD